VSKGMMISVAAPTSAATSMMRIWP